MIISDMFFPRPVLHSVPHCPAIERKVLVALGLSFKVIRTLLSSRRISMLKTYGPSSVCGAKRTTLIQGILEFLPLWTFFRKVQIKAFSPAP